MNETIVFVEQTGKRKSKYRCIECGEEFEILDVAFGENKKFIHVCHLPEDAKKYEGIEINGIQVHRMIGRTKSTTSAKKDIHIEAVCKYCGNHYPAILNAMRAGKAYQHCGCYKKPESKYNDLTGQKFGRLTALRLADGRGRSGERLWVCVCDCSPDVERIYGSIALRAGQVKSCGCYCRDQTRAANRKRFDDLSGQKFSLLTAEYPTNKRYGGKHEGQGFVVWHCKCDCGGERDVPSNLLKNGSVKSCGCISSYGEMRIETCLREMNVTYKKHKKFDSCRNDQTGYMLFFDFWLPDDNILIEYDGEQHYGYMEANTWNSEENFNEVFYRDALKNDWCLKNDISLIRIPFSEINNVTSEYLTELISEVKLGAKQVFVEPKFTAGISSRDSFIIKTTIPGKI